MLGPYEALIREELNVKSVSFTQDVETVAERVLTLVPATIGPRLGPDTQRVIAAVKRGDWQEVEGGVAVDGITLSAANGEYELRLRPRDEESGRALPKDTGIVILDTEVDPELELEGLARDVVRQVQAARREAGLAVTDCIILHIEAPKDVVDALGTHKDYVAEQTLAAEVEVTPAASLSIRVTKTACP
jgi:isoleucyl-tRNA synthetase